MRLLTLTFLPLAIVVAQSQDGASSAATSSSASDTDSASSSAFTPSPVSTTVPTATVAPDTPVPGQGEYPPAQWWCNDGGNGTYCPSKLLQDVQLAGIFPDSKTFVDKPTLGTLNDTVAAFNALGPNRTVGQILSFAEAHFQGEGLELEQVEIEGFIPSPAILDNVTDPILHGWVKAVHGYWQLLIRETNQSSLCQPGVCDSSLIPLNNTIVVPGGRYREIYYWDSYWILQGLLKSELHVYAWKLIQNFMDLIELYGFLPNGGRKYYLDRSQPPVFVLMINEYIKASDNLTILERALPLMSAELDWFQNNRTMQVTSPFTGKVHTVAHYDVKTSGPRPEGYVEDYEAAYGASPALNESGRSDLYAELASGAESGWDYSSRWCRQPMLNKSDNNQVLRTLNIRATIPVDLTSLLAADHAMLADLYELHAQAASGSAANSSTGMSGTVTQVVVNPSSTTAGDNEYTVSQVVQPSSSGDDTVYTVTRINQPPTTGNIADRVHDPENTTTTTGDKVKAKIKYHREMAANYSAAVLDLHWDPERAYFYDYNVTVNDRAKIYSPAGLWPLWFNITPPGLLLNETLALSIASGTRFLLGKYAGSPSVATLLESGLNWDFPNVWPPHAYSTIKALETIMRAVPSAGNLSTITLANYSDVTPGQLGIAEADLPRQPPETIGNTSLTVSGLEALPWPRALAVQIANRYITAAFCSWYSTGGSIPGSLSRLPGTPQNLTGVMFEKFNVTDPDASGGGGEYSVQVGFGWTNGVVLWTAGEYGQYLPKPTCPLIPIEEGVAPLAPENTTDGMVYGSGQLPIGSGAGGASGGVEYYGHRTPR